MKCSAWKEWKLVNDEMIPTIVCKNEAVYLLSSPPHWNNIPYCDSCACCMVQTNTMFDFGLVVEEIDK